MYFKASYFSKCTLRLRTLEITRKCTYGCTLKVEKNLILFNAI
nr:MAG TPA: hypothetical protein [Caudoviricetes sp.]